MSIKIFGVGPASNIAAEVCKKLGLELSPIKEERFPDGELKVRPEADVKNSNVFVFHSLGGDTERTVNDRLCELYFLLCTLRDHGASRVTAIIPYFPYARADQRKVPFDSITNRYVAQILEASGVNRVVSMDVHNIAAFENAFRCPVLNIEAAPLFCQYVASQIKDNTVVLSPDIGGIKRAEKFRKLLESLIGVPVGSAFLEKFRTENGITGSRLVGEVKGRNILIVDDMISTGDTILRALEACRTESTGSIKIFASHGLFLKNQEQLLNSSLVDEIVVTDSHPASKNCTSFKKLKILSCSELFLNLLT